MAGIATGLLLTDRDAVAGIGSGNLKRASQISDAGLIAYSGGVALLYLYGRTSSSKAKETGILAAEAGINSLVVHTALSYGFSRERPLEGGGAGRFFRPVATSFYSGHSTVAWSFASVIAQEYPGWLSKALAYGVASGVSLSRLKAKEHFPSDVFVGAVSGYLIGRDVYRRRHNPEVDDSFGTFVNVHPEWNSGNAGTSYVPLDSWTYPVFEKLISLGYVRYQFLGLKPWTRTACAEMVAEAQSRIDADNAPSSEAISLLDSLRKEFADESKLGSSFDNTAIRLESVYSRSAVIAGPPLNDSYHFGQTITNDFGRLFQRGFNQIIGFTARAEQGRFSYFVRGEYQHAPSGQAYPLSVREVIADMDGTEVAPATIVPQTNRFALIDAYASMTIAGHVVSVGKQGMWWGPGKGGAMILSNNAEPFYLVRIDRAIPLKLPWILKYLGPVRYDGYFGALAEHSFPRRPFMHGEKFSFKPTENLELGFSRTAVFAGEGVSPLTFGVLWKSLTSAVSSTTPGADPRISPGARHGQFDFSYRIPGLRKWLTLYSDSLVHDDVSPIAAPRRAAINPGIYLTRFPGLSKLDLRVEAVNTDPPIVNSLGGKFFYWESVYRDLYLNKSRLLGHWIGREGKGIQAWSTYWISPVNTIQAGYRNAKIAKDFVPGGETVNDFSLRSTIRIAPQLQVAASVQYEQWLAPILSPGLQRNWTGSLQITYWPKQFVLHRR
ncbi:MAG TPA: capsule assembly Wzi family protein [Terriglobales bacterium]|nr:capsule assembly Wzi family protein [Terriglobales bacterium]